VKLEPPEEIEDFRDRLLRCPPGHRGWREFEDVGTSILSHLFCPPLEAPRIQTRSISGIDRRDAIFANRIVDTSSSWGLIRHDYGARLIPVEFKNYDREEIGKDEVDQARNYLKTSWGRLTIICCNKEPERAAHVRRNTVYSSEEKVILFVTTADLCEMLDMKLRNEDPSRLLLDKIDGFFLEYE
jgi:hypothetical protein